MEVNMPSWKPSGRMQRLIERRGHVGRSATGKSLKEALDERSNDISLRTYRAVVRHYYGFMAAYGRRTDFDGSSVSFDTFLSDLKTGSILAARNLGPTMLAALRRVFLDESEHA